MDEQVLDIKDVMERVQDDRELLLELFDIFETDYQEKRQQLQEYTKKKDLNKLKDVVHSLKGAAGNISAKSIHATCIAIEQAVPQKDFGLIEKLVAQVDTEFAKLQAAIVQFKKR